MQVTSELLKNVTAVWVSPENRKRASNYFFNFFLAREIR